MSSRAVWKRRVGAVCAAAALGLLVAGGSSAPGARAEEPVTLRIASYNVLGDVHTAPYEHDDEFAPSRIRAEWMADVLTRMGGPDIVGLQEVQAAQLKAIMRATGDRYAAWPADKVPGGGPQSLLWDKSVWQATDKQTISIPFITGQRPQPVVRLRHLATGREIWVLNVHNAPAELQGQRNVAVSREIAKILELRATGLPVFLLGDMNEKTTVFCKVVGQTDLISPLGGSAGPSGCKPPTARMRVDWLFLSEDVTVDSFAMYQSPLKSWSTDHVTIPVAGVTLP
ncbi:MAG TPA: endonuclease/exonuclease/phosphatase family protein [Nocardioides sp.]|uniref:endonuclease/exonuclease/phosphatase family protein n=1 Tax=Nocardioides sp. TaxID=35761 RepID=UPI002C136277|nr:endonuclease/exonuclease/phosphatase family protein [Nocardioides sp.]HQR26626.1 endonuclease/exonuclease/phosphatase family protein [Nocardioides sp.]